MAIKILNIVLYILTMLVFSSIILYTLLKDAIYVNPVEFQDTILQTDEIIKHHSCFSTLFAQFFD